MRIPAYLAATVLAFLLVASPAQARQRPMTWDYAANVAVDYWADRGIHVSCHPRYDTMPDYDYSILAVADLATCTVILSETAEWYGTQREYAWIYCQTVVHEIGHLAGLEHSYGGVMDHEANVVPKACVHQRKARTSKRKIARRWQRSRYAQSWQP